MPEHHQPDRLIPPREARKLLGIGKTSEAIYRSSIAGFPPRVRVGPRLFAYRQSDIAAFIASLPAAPTAPAPKRAAKGTPATPETTGG